VNGLVVWSSAIPGGVSCQGAAPDGAGGVWFAWAGNPHWPAPKLLASGSDGFLAAWHDSGAYYGGFGSVGMIKVQRFTTAGVVDPAWPTNGVRLSTSWTWDEPTHVISDGAGGLHQVWCNGANSLLWTHLQANGSFAPGHSAAGINPLPGDAVLRYSNPVGFTGVAASDGGLIIGWDDHRSGPPPSMHVRWLLSNGTPDLSQGERIVPGPAADGALTGGAYAFWGDANNTYMNHEAIAGPLAVAPAPRPQALALAMPWPNPARDAISVRCSLPDDRTASLALYDVGGRRLRTLDVSGAGSRTVSLDRLASLRPGLYLLRLTHAGESRSERVVVTR
jgi:hypothetical protein